MIPTGSSDVEKIVESVLLYVFKMALTASLFSKTNVRRTKAVPKLYFRASEEQYAKVPYGQIRGPGRSGQPWVEVSQLT